MLTFVVRDPLTLAASTGSECSIKTIADKISGRKRFAFILSLLLPNVDLTISRSFIELLEYVSRALFAASLVFGLFGAFGVPVNSLSFALVIVGGMLSMRCPYDHSFLRTFPILIPFIIISEKCLVLQLALNHFHAQAALLAGDSERRQAEVPCPPR